MTMYHFRGVEDAPAMISALQKCVDRKEPVTLTYVKADGSVTVRTVEPYDFAVKSGNALLLALDRESGEPRSWRLDRIKMYSPHRRAHRTLVHAY